MPLTLQGNNLNFKCIVIFVLLISSLSIIGSIQVCNASTDYNLLSDQTYSSSQYGFSINPPKNWSQNTVSQYMAEFVNVGPTTCYLAVWTNLNVSYSLDGYYDFTLNSWKSLKNFNITSEEDASVAGYQSKQIVYTATSQNVDLKSKAVFFLQNNNGYVLLYTASPEEYDQHLAAFDQSIQTFKTREATNSNNQTLGSNFSWIIIIIVGLIAAITILIVLFSRKRIPKNQ
jgi:hypothetical protein